MIAHSLPSKVFGPAQNIHGATYIADVSFFSNTIDENNIVIDIGLAQTIIKEVCGELNYQFLDELPRFEGVLTTTEFLAKYMHDQIKTKVASVFNGSINVELRESSNAWASYHGNDED